MSFHSKVTIGIYNEWQGSLEVLGISLETFEAFIAVSPTCELDVNHVVHAILFMAQLYDDVNYIEFDAYVKSRGLPGEAIHSMIIKVLHVLHICIKYNTITRYLPKMETTDKLAEAVFLIYYTGIRRIYEPRILAENLVKFINNEREDNVVLNQMYNMYETKTILKAPSIHVRLTTNYLKSLNQYDKTMIIGTGSYGEVYRCTSLVQYNMRLAIKEMVVNDISISPIHQSTLREISILSSINHPNIINIISVGYTDNTWFYIMPELAMTIRSYYDNESYISKTEKRNHIRQLLHAMNYLHTRGIMHRDISFNNIMMDAYSNLVIIDFGMARTFTKNDTMYSGDLCSIWTRPFEILCGLDEYTFRSDLWSIACIIYFILNGDILFHGDNYLEMTDSIYSVLGVPTDECVLTWPEYVEPKIPYSPTYIYAEYDFEDVNNVIRSMLEYDPDKRVTCAQALKLIGGKK